MTNKERIEAYFDDQLSTTEKESLLRDIESNQDLKTEFEFQQEVVEGIQAYRKQELISRLNKVEVASVGSSSLAKIIGIIGAATLISGGLYWYFNDDTTSQLVTTETEVLENTNPEQMTDEIIVPQEKTAEAVELAEESTGSNSKGNIEKPAASETKTAESAAADVKVPEMIEPDSEDISAVAVDHDAPKSLSSESLAVASSADVEIKLDKKYNFHYQVSDGNLTLYGNFNDSKFEVIELKTTLGIRLYLFYNQRYFELKSDSDKVRPLEVVENKEIISELDKRRL